MAIDETPHYEQYLYEKAMFERYGSVSSIGFEEWLEIKGYTSSRIER